MATITKFEEIISWKKASELNKILGKLIAEKRFEQHYRLINQMECAAGSVMDTIDAGFERGANRESIQFLFMPKESCGDLGSQLYKALDRNYISLQGFDFFSSCNENQHPYSKTNNIPRKLKNKRF